MQAQCRLKRINAVVSYCKQTPQDANNLTGAKKKVFDVIVDTPIGSKQRCAV
jgi:hypothetical protein